MKKQEFSHGACIFGNFMLEILYSKESVTLSVDASKNGAVFLQGHPLAFGSVLLTQTQPKYIKIEKRATSLVICLVAGIWFRAF